MRTLLFLTGVLFLIGCKKEKALTPNIKFDHVYNIEDDPSNPIKHRVYELYKDYNVPVYFNDTIGKVFITNDVQGKPIYNYEKLDLAWGFNFYGNYKYDFEYMSDPDEMNKALDIIENYLKLADKALYPFSFFVTTSGTKYNTEKVLEEYKNGKFEISYRTIFLSGNWTEALMKSLPEEIMRQMVSNKILNYPDEIELFGRVSQQTWYGGVAWSSLTNVAAGWTCAQLYDNWYLGPTMTAEEWELKRKEARAVVGQFGFVWGNQRTLGLQTPGDINWDLQGYIWQMLKYSPEEFEEAWGSNSLVMKKYNILSNVIVNKLGVKL